MEDEHERQRRAIDSIIRSAAEQVGRIEGDISRDNARLNPK